MLSGEIQVGCGTPRRIGWGCCITRIIWSTSSRPDGVAADAGAYKDLEDQGYFLVIVKVEIKYKSPAHYDDVLTIRTTVTRTTPVRLEHNYEVFRDGTLLCEGATTLACVDREGKLQAMPAWLLEAN